MDCRASIFQVNHTPMFEEDPRAGLTSGLVQRGPDPVNVSLLVQPEDRGCSGSLIGPVAHTEPGI